MADPVNQTEPVVPAPASNELPASASPTLPAAASIPAEAAAVSQAAAAAEVAPAAPAAEAKPAEPAAKAAEPVREKTLLEKFDAEEKTKADEAAAKAKEAKPAEAKPGDKPAAEPKPGDKPADKATADKAAEAKPAEPAAPEPIAYEYALPETIKMDDALKGEFHSALDKFRADPAKGAQGLIDMHTKAMTTFAEQTLHNQFKVFNETKAAKEKEALADTEIGGAGHQTAMKAIARARDLSISSAKPGTPRYEAERKEFEQFLEATGAGSWPPFLRLLHNAARYIDEPQGDKQPLEDLKPPKNNGRSPGSKLYDHPSSQRMTRS